MSRNETAIVRSIFRLATEQRAGVEIAGELNRAGFSRRNGSAWTARQVLDVLSRQDLYRRGVVKYGEGAGADENLVLIETSVTSDSKNENGASY